MDRNGIGLCHNCFNSNVKVRNYDGDVLCDSCFSKKFPKKTFINPPEIHEPTMTDLKRKFQKDWN